MPGLALALYVVYLLVAFIVRGVIQRRRTGDSGFRFGAEAVGSPQWWARLGFVAALVAAALAPVLALLGLHEAIGALDQRWIALTGAIVTVGGILVTFVAQVAMGASWRVGVDPTEQTELVVRWPFTVVRNPIFTAMAVTAMGFTFMVPSPLAIGALALLLWALRYQVRVVEEPYLRQVHGERYAAYASQVGRFLPGLGRLHAPSGA